MKKALVLALAGILASGFVAVAGLAGAAEYDRYERGTAAPPPPPPPPRGAQVAPPRHALHGQPYFFGHMGLFDPNGNGDGLSGYDSGGSIEFGFGSRVAPAFAFEGAFGGYGTDRGPDEASVVPMTIGARLIVPNPFIEPYIGAGLGVYFSSLREVPRPGYSGIDDDSADFGGYLSAGLDMWLNQRVALNFEGKYHYVEPTYHTNAGNSVDVDMSGWTVNFGVRIAF